ncbi:hypothetical protein AVEN_261089-1 [Araneus ventricosus]|uniref:Uncharacterized protein n=1 Tax=Araneus ventricosus TaxID=182803 RepID=A0A4Y2W615_ARAVE|nr:hypothetical protein AVEN_261089-1 [Araneus ventricosus]
MEILESATNIRVFICDVHGNSEAEDCPLGLYQIHDRSPLPSSPTRNPAACQVIIIPRHHSQGDVAEWSESCCTCGIGTLP